jgi:hypothetical protein
LQIKKGRGFIFHDPFGIKKGSWALGCPRSFFRDNKLLISVRWRTPGIWFASATIFYKNPYKLGPDAVSFVLPISSFIFETSLSIIASFCQHFIWMPLS